MSDIGVVPLVLDNGTGTCKAGFAGDDIPRTIFSTLLGRPLHEKSDQQSCYIGNEAQSNAEILNLTYPMEHGIVKNWEDMEKIWQHMFQNDLCVQPEKRPILLSEAPRNPVSNREKMAELLFENFKVPAFYVSPPAVLAMYACGRTSGVALESGDGLSHVIPIYEGYALPEAIIRVDLGGRDLTRYMEKLLGERDWFQSAKMGFEKIREVKEQFCYVAEDFNNELDAALSSEKSFKLPDGKMVSIGSERFRCPEILFDPSLVDVRAPGVHEMIHGSVVKCDVDIRKELFGNIIISGGNTLLPGFVERVTGEVKKMVATSMKIKTIAQSDRKDLAWTGGSILASLRSFQPMWISKKEYEEHGFAIFSKKIV